MTKPSPDDIALFRQAVKGVKPLKQEKYPPLRPAIPAIPRQRQLDDEEVIRDMLSDGYEPADLETGEELLFVRPGVTRTTLRRLRRGYYSVLAELDLHGMVAPEARAAVSAFLHQCRQRDIGCVRIIHGKGRGSKQRQPILKIKLNHWLRLFDEVLAFCSARNVDGGTGAVYVLIKQTKVTRKK